MENKNIVGLVISVKETVRTVSTHFGRFELDVVETRFFEVLEEKGVEVAELLDVADTVIHILE
jgi:hypothetical protein